MPPQVFTRDECEALGRRVLGMVSVPQAEVGIFQSVTATNTFARGDVHQANTSAKVYVSLMAGGDGRFGDVSISQVDDASLRALVQETEAAAREHRGYRRQWTFLGSQDYAVPAKLRFESTLDAMNGEARNETARRILTILDQGGLIGAGSVSLGLNSGALLNNSGLFGYVSRTTTELTVSGRTKDGMGSGWAWAGPADWHRVDVDAIARRAVDLAQRSAKPVAVEPGRYTVIIEPYALQSLMGWLVGWIDNASEGGTPYSKEPPGNTKLGLKVIDERLSVITDLWDSERALPTVNMNFGGMASKNTTWIDRGVLTNLVTSRTYAREHGREVVARPDGFRLAGAGPTQSLEEMIATTKRGIWINRFGNLAWMSERTGLMSGTTRDGTFLIENGKITKAVKNLRFTESIFFILNRVESFGEPVQASDYVVAPRIKVRDFDFTSLTDAI